MGAGKSEILSVQLLPNHLSYASSKISKTLFSPQANVEHRLHLVQKKKKQELEQGLGRSWDCLFQVRPYIVFPTLY